jgi:hypothetical protein
VAQDDTLSRKNAYWTQTEEVALIEFLTERKGDMTSGNTFKEKVFSQAAEKIKHLHQRGAIKDFKSCKSKWTSVCISLYVLYLYADCMTS